MSPILGVWASAQQRASIVGSYDSIASGAGSVGGITFSSIPQTYQHLQLRCLVRSTSANPDYFFMRFNGSASSYYTGHYLTGDGSTAFAQENPTTRSDLITSSRTPGTGQTSNVFSGIIIDILDYTNANKNKTVRILGGYDANGSGTLSLSSGLWMNTSAITSIALAGFAGGIETNSYWSLYGIKG